MKLKLVMFLLESLLFLAELETCRFLWWAVDTNREMKGIPGQMVCAFVSMKCLFHSDHDINDHHEHLLSARLSILQTFTWFNAHTTLWGDVIEPTLHSRKQSPRETKSLRSGRQVQGLNRSVALHSEIFNMTISGWSDQKWILFGGCLGGSVGWASLWLDFGSGHELTLHRIEPCVGLCTDCSEPAWDSLSLSLSLSQPLSPCPAHTSVLSLKVNKYF